MKEENAQYKITLETADSGNQFYYVYYKLADSWIFSNLFDVDHDGLERAEKHVKELKTPKQEPIVIGFY